MLPRRTFIKNLTALPLATIVATTTASAQNVDLFEWSFNQLSQNEKRSLQTELQIAGLYTSTVDGQWGPSTRRAVVAAPNFINQNSGGRMNIQPKTTGDLITLFKEIAQGKHSRWLYGDV